MKTEIGERLEVWRGYCERLMNVGNDWDGEVDYVLAEGPWEVSEKERGVRNGGKTGVKRIWRCIRCCRRK